MILEFPWDVHPDLTEERLTIIGQLLFRARSNAVLRYNEDIGDDGWTLGCSAFQFCRFEIIKAALSGEYPWLTVTDQSKHLIFHVGAVPVRFYRGESDDPTKRTLAQSFPEFEQLLLIFPDDDSRQNLVYRFAVETDIDGSVLEIKFVGLRGPDPLLCWTVPIDRSAPIMVPVGEPAEGVDLPAPAVVVPGKKDETKAV